MDIRIHQGSLSPRVPDVMSKSSAASQPVSQNAQSLPQSEVENENEQDQRVVLSKELDEEATGYKEDNPVFKEDYENLEKAMDLIQAQIHTLQERIDKLMQSREQRFMKINHQQDITPDDGAVIAEHVGSKKYRDNTVTDEVKELEKQLSELKGQEAQLRTQMLKAILAERERLEELKSKGKL
ncbi:hypothetical protein HUZ36_10930 [Pseudoalteromonas sp. McH1-7]|uniref:Uncharacterized protein n=1 Tax=Pseudoalteromonas peptidolytica F12-50-A1 TaxID=1315280 RepID=A0A8I0T3V3_9GAMM|nr:MULTISPECIES: hypothetical protein [Pseudoalteromonas]MBE0345632.1 hypothetical protein [Pseudoalteromonas peptidolytica F12-50-A1]NLR13566.1 hypothetical protein [Pseudoalteromonas peptidolytica]NUZ11296.1 hypothetical protein [Pseudoalteromonas sp. McH1-7]USD27658.1 hypothetical protein J8Z24_11930 [Pseudoalteromonas sp. SCSIO 43201]GEK11737.1 hypothetical protein PPE03_39860 [Pseudoalteromonas peptidolytica]